MDHKRAVRSLRALLLTASVLTAAPVLAQEQSTAARLDRLERLVEGLIARLDAEATTHQVEEAEIREQSAALLAATRDLKDRQAELAQQIAVPKGQEDKGFRVGKTTVA